MDSALAWIGQIASWIGQWIPRWVLLDLTDGAVKSTGFFLPRTWRVKWGGFDGEMKVTVLGPGLHWFWPATSTFISYPTALQTDNLPTQTLTTSDGKVINVSGMVTYTVNDLGKLLTQTHSAIKLIQVYALAALHDVCTNLSWEKLQEEERKRTLNTKLRHAAQKMLTKYGVVVEDFMLTDHMPTRALRLIQSTQNDDD
jgi:regulator of protease activity HflC (stomatin/prohibitin superfamily)